MIRHEADACEAEKQHRPCGRFGDGRGQQPVRVAGGIYIESDESTGEYVPLEMVYV
jgi:hypothetical protein